MGDEVRQALRSLRHRPFAVLTAVVCLGLALGANTVLFGVVDALLLRPPAGVASPGEVMRVRVGAAAGPGVLGAGPSMTYPQARSAAELLDAVAAAGVYAPRTLSLGSGAGAVPVEAVIADAGYFTVLGIRPHRGRLFVAGEDDAAGATPVAVLSHETWRRRFAGDDGVAGRVIELNGVPVTVVGVAPPRFAGVDPGAPELWLNTGAVVREEFGGPRQHGEWVYWLQMLARRRAGVPDGAVADVLEGRGRDPYSAAPFLPLHALPLRAMFFAEQAGRNPVPVWALGIALVVLLLACATVANLLLAQGAVREGEIAVRLALGAPRRRILRQLLLENLLIAAAAAAAALLLAAWSSRLVRLLPIPTIPQLIDARAAAFAFVIALLTTLLFGVMPAVWTARGDLDAVLRRGGARGGSVVRLQNGLMAVQIAISFVLLVSAGLFVASFRNASAIETGFDLDRIAEVTLPLAGIVQSDDHARRFTADVAERISATPGIEGAARGSIVPFYMFSRGGFTIPDGRSDEDQPRSELIDVVSTDYFRTLGIRLAEGRGFTSADARGEPVAVISRAMARHYWREGSALDACIRLTGRHSDACVRVVGITDDVKYRDLSGEPTRVLFLLDAQDPGGGPPPRTARLFVRVAGEEPMRSAAAIRNAIHSVDDALPFVRVRPLSERVRPARIPWEVGAMLFTAFGALATLLAAAGLCMVVAFAVRQRTRELGIRSALGASPRTMLRLVLGHGMRVSSAGLLAGAFIASIVTRVLASYLYGVTPTDPLAWLAAAALILAVALAACLAPARSAAKVDPLTVLRSE